MLGSNLHNPDLTHLKNNTQHPVRESRVFWSRWRTQRWDFVGLAVAFPRSTCLAGPSFGNSSASPCVGGWFTASHTTSGTSSWNSKAGELPHAAAFLRYAPSGERNRHSHGTRFSWAQRFEYHDDLHTCYGQTRVRRPQSVRCVR